MFLSEDRIPNDLASAVTGDDPLTMSLTKGHNSSDAEFFDRMVESSLHDSSDRVRQFKGLIEMEIHDCITESAN